MQFDYEKYKQVCIQSNTIDCQKRYPFLNNAEYNKVIKIIDIKEGNPESIFSLKPISQSNMGIDGPDGSRGGALHHYTPRFSVGCFTFNSGNDTSPIQKLIDNLPDLPLNDKKPVRFIVKERKVKESTWSSSSFGTKKWIGI